MSLTRKEFLNSVVGAVAGAAGAAVLVACGSSDSPADSGPPPNCLMNGTSTNIGSNHGHVLVVSKTDVTAGVAKTYDITGTATHAHSVTISAAMLTMLQGNTSAMTISTTNENHSHSITVVCV